MAGAPYSIKTKRGTTSTVVQGIPEVIGRLGEIADAAQDISPAWDDLAGMFAARQDSVFNSNGWGKWAPRAPSTIAEGVSPLVQTGIMRDAITRRRPIWSKKHAAAFGADKSEGSHPGKTDSRIYKVAVLNTVGHRRGSKQVPERVIVPRLRAAEKRQWLQVIERHIVRALSE